MANIIKLKNPTELSGYYIVFEGAANIEFAGVRGISHLMEHLQCKNIDKYMDEFERKGLDYNAYTDFDRIVFHITGIDDVVSKFKDTFLEEITSFKITEETLENEKKIVCKEYNSYVNTPGFGHFMNLLRKKLDNYMAIGEIDDIKNITLDDCKQWFDLVYKNPVKIIDIYKDAPDEGCTNTSSTTNKEWKFEDHEFIFQKFPEDELLSPIYSENHAKSHFLMKLLSSGLSSPLYQLFREQNHLCYDISMSAIKLGNQYVLEINSLTSPDNNEKFFELFETLRQNLAEYLTEKRFDIVKERHQIDIKVANINRWTNAGKYIEPVEWDMEKLASSVTYEEMLEYAKFVMLGDWHISESKEEFK